MNFAAVTFAEKSTQNSEQLSNVSSEAAQLASEPLASATADQPPDQTQGEAMQDEAMQGEAMQGKATLLPAPSEASMQDYYQLQQNLLGLTLAFGAVIFPFVWVCYSLPIALDYLLGACAGAVYFRMLGKNVSRIGRQQKNSSIGRLAVFAGVMIVALRWDQLEVIPVFLGFLTYKAAIIAFILWTVVKPQKKTA